MGNASRYRKSVFIVVALALLAGITPFGRAAPAPTERWLRIRIGGRDRLCLMHIPAAYDGTRAVPLVLMLHGEASNAEIAQRITGLTARSDRDGFIVAYPDGSGTARRRGLTWNAGSCCGYAQARRIDDIAFLRALTDHIRKDWRIDPRRIYLAGFGNGGMMAYRAACELSADIAAAAVVGGALMGRCAPAQPVSVLAIHGSVDPVVPYQGGRPARRIGGRDRVYPSVATAVAFWVKHNGCQTTPRRTEQGKVVVETYPGGRNATEVSLITIEGGGHAWPAGAPPEFSATSAALDFFAAHPKGAGPTAR